MFWDHPLIVTARLEQSFDDWIYQCKLWDVDVTLAVTELGFTGLSVTCILNSMLMQINYFFRIDILYSCTYNIRRVDYIKQLCEKN